MKERKNIKLDDNYIFIKVLNLDMNDSDISYDASDLVQGHTLKHMSAQIA